ncbi:hypothetical protein FB567DRAFT_9340 [Paraphoma chrysanthemicola]|uniref:Uncharacterized protein n=1 Tax=Paraphoma chrysanthemicola TaxID=798071 RepID=A0A8K0W488_9PLEO|nr:hypothetical protein FB567DRAFT_9340 [Paraphoma chrysanthemicola]
MAVLEVTQLCLSGFHASDAQLLGSLSVVLVKPQTSSKAYSCVEDPTKLYILGIWPTLEAHLIFLASPGRHEVLGPQEAMLKLQWTIQVGLDSMSSLPLVAPILALEKCEVA